MTQPQKFGRMQTAFEDVVNRTLSPIQSDIGRLIYLASMRDYNSGTYQHDGLADRFSPKEASAALNAAHREVFSRLAGMSLEELVADLERYIKSSEEIRAQFLRTWSELEPYRVAIPMNEDSTAAQLLLSNIRVALEVLRLRLQKAEEHPSGAWQLPSPAR